MRNFSSSVCVCCDSVRDTKYIIQLQVMASTLQIFIFDYLFGGVVKVLGIVVNFDWVTNKEQSQCKSCQL